VVVVVVVVERSIPPRRNVLAFEMRLLFDNRRRHRHVGVFFIRFYVFNFFLHFADAGIVAVVFKVLDRRRTVLAVVDNRVESTVLVRINLGGVDIVHVIVTEIDAVVHAFVFVIVAPRREPYRTQPILALEFFGAALSCFCFSASSTSPAAAVTATPLHVVVVVVVVIGGIVVAVRFVLEPPFLGAEGVVVAGALGLESFGDAGSSVLSIASPAAAIAIAEAIFFVFEKEHGVHNAVAQKGRAVFVAVVASSAVVAAAAAIVPTAIGIGAVVAAAFAPASAAKPGRPEPSKGHTQKGSQQK